MKVFLCFLVLITTMSCRTSVTKKAWNPAALPGAELLQKDTESRVTVAKGDLQSLKAEYGDYRLGPGDVIQLFATDVPEISQEYTIGPDGKLTIPIVGVLDVEGMTRAEAAIAIGAKLEGNYLNPKVDVLVKAYNNNRIYVLGEVRWPGEFNFAGRPKLLSALSRAQGLTKDADLRGCTIVRGKGAVIEVDLYELINKGNRELNLTLLPEDTVYVKKDDERMFFVMGEVRRPGVFSRGKRMDVVRAIAMAGGASENGLVDAVRIIRRQGAEAEVFKVNLKHILRGNPNGDVIPIESGDIVYVPRKGIATFNYLLRQITPSLSTYLLWNAVDSVGKDDD
jgi:polysaccharide export outer membrane protein